MIRYLLFLPWLRLVVRADCFFEAGLPIRQLLMRIKSLDLLRQEAAESGENSLKRSLGAFNLVAIGIGVIIGAGLFSLTGLAAANHAGPAVTLSFVVAAVGCAFSALCYAEFATLVLRANEDTQSVARLAAENCFDDGATSP